MRKFFSILAVMAILSSCGEKGNTDPDNQDTQLTPKVSVSVTEIKDNTATINAVVTEGKSTSGKIVKIFLTSSIDFDYEDEIELITFIEQNGQAITLPYSEVISNVKDDTDYITAVIVYDDAGRPANASMQIWTGEGVPEGWSDVNNGGSLRPNEW